MDQYEKRVRLGNPMPFNRLNVYPVRTLDICPKCRLETHPGDMVEGERVWCTWCFYGVKRED